MVLLTSLLSQQANSQTVVIDSLKNLLNLSEKKDTSYLILLRNIGDEFYEENFDSTLYYYSNSLELSRSLPHYKVEISTLRSLGFLYSFRKNDYDKSLIYFSGAKEKAWSEGDSLNMAIACSDIGRIYWKQGQSNKALEQHLEVRKIGEILKSDQLLLRANLSIGIIHNEEGANQKALQFYEDAYAIADSIGHESGKGLLLNNMGTAYKDEGDHGKALTKFKASEAIFSKIKNNGRLALVNTNIGENYLIQNLLDTAIFYFDKALRYNQKVNDNEQRAMILSGLASAQLKKKNYTEAITSANSGLVALSDVETDLYFNDLYQTLAEGYSALGDQVNALNSYRALLSSKEKLNKKEQSKEIQKLLALYEEQKKETEIQKLNLVQEKNAHELEKSKSLVQLLISGLVLLIVLGFLFFTFVRFKAIQRINKLKNKLAKDLHDNIGSSLNHIKLLSNRLARGNHTKELQLEDAQRIKKLSNEVMYDMYDMLWTIDNNKSSIGDLKQHIQDHIFNTVRFNDCKIKTDFTGLNENKVLDITVKSNIYAIFKEAINNIIKHTNSDNIFISLKGLPRNKLELVIQNDFKVRITDTQFSTKKGLINIKARADEIKGDLKIIETAQSFALQLNWKN